jgi:hypothetical protein
MRQLVKALLCAGLWEREGWAPGVWNINKIKDKLPPLTDLRSNCRDNKECTLQSHFSC